MKKIKFVFKNNDDILYDLSIPYEKKGEFISFLIEEVSFKIKLSDDFELYRITDEYRFLLKANSEGKSCQFYLVEIDSTFDIDILFFEYIKEGSKHFIKYSVASDEENIKTIILSFID